ncbi:hypothetical protein MMC24_005110 [Lignoscripta atroalba]|nr:hypothetical protein [Lignoscripta atroalba]
MSFSFLNLPPEIRNKIYQILFQGSKSNVVQPIKKVHHPKPMLPWIRDGVPLLRVCKIVNAEAAAILYGRNVFCFDDSSRGVGGEKINECAITAMYAFLRLIGVENRLRIRYLQIEMHKFRFCYYDNESIVGARAETNGGKYLGDAFELLSRGHGLKEICIELDCESNRAKLPSHLFRPIEESKLLQQLQKIKGLKSFRCRMKDPESEAQLIYQKLKHEMTQRVPRKKKAKENNGVDTKAQNLGKKLADMARHRLELQQRIEEASTQVEEWKELQARIEDTSKQVEQWQEETRVIDQAFETFEELSSQVTMQIETVGEPASDFNNQLAVVSADSDDDS